MKNLFRALCATVFIVGILVFSLAQHKNQAEISSDVDDIEPARSYVVKTIQYHVSPDGTKKIISQSTAYLKSNGEWRRIDYGPNGPRGDNLLAKNSNDLNVDAGLPDGVYMKERGSNTLTYLSPMPDEKMLRYFRSHKYFRENRDFVRIDRVVGLKVYVLRHEIKNPESNIEWVEESYSPKTGIGALRSIMHFRDGSEVWNEAVSVEFKEVPEDLNDDLKGLPVKNMEEKIRKQNQQ